MLSSPGGRSLRSAVDVGLQVSPQVIEQAIHSVRGHYTPRGCKYTDSEETQKQYPGQFTYKKGGGNATTAMAAAGVVCLQEFAQYDDWRISKSLDVIAAAIQHDVGDGRRGNGVFDPYTLYYVAQALYQAGGKPWQENYPKLRDALVQRQSRDGMWAQNGRLSGRPGDLYMTSVACFVLAIPNRYLPILQEGKIDSLKEQFQKKPERAR